MMARPPRLVVPGLPLHIVQRGNNRGVTSTRATLAREPFGKGRFRSSAVDSERWTGSTHHAARALRGARFWTCDRQAAYRALFDGPLATQTLDAIRGDTKTRGLVGGDEFRALVEAKIHRSLA